MSARLGTLALGCALVVAGPAPQQGPTPDAELELRVTAGAGDVGFGTGFPLTVVRSWDRGFVPDEWSVDVLAPLTVELLDERTSETEERIEETRRYRAYLFRGGEVTVPAPWFRARSVDGETVRVAFADELVFRVTSALGDGEPGPVELPGDVLPAPFAWRRWAGVIVLGVIVLAAGVWFVRRRRIGAGRAMSAPVERADARALARLARLRAAAPGDREAVRMLFVEVSAAVRDYVAERFGIPASERATEELLAVGSMTDALPAASRALLEELLTRSDLVKFACDEPDAGERARLLDVAEAFVRGTRTDDAATESGGEP